MGKALLLAMPFNRASERKGGYSTNQKEKIDKTPSSVKIEATPRSGA